MKLLLLILVIIIFSISIPYGIVSIIFLEIDFRMWSYLTRGITAISIIVFLIIWMIILYDEF